MIGISVNLISGFMLGIEFAFDDKAMMIDLGIIRFIVFIPQEHEE